MPKKIGFSTYAENFQGGNITADEWDFIKAIAAYQKRWNRRYPSWREVLHIALCLGYRKVAEPVPIDVQPTDAEAELAAKAKQSKARDPKHDIPTEPPVPDAVPGESA
jgi:hypothetical protein